MEKIQSNYKHPLPVHENLLNQQFVAEAPNEVWMTDITYIPTDEGWLYLASVMDLYSRKIVGFHMDFRMTKESVIQALDQAYRVQRLGKGVKAKKQIFEYITCFYNGKRIYSSLGYVSPNQYERLYRKPA
jgi:transposase InsO family protein